jgi:hypothetical protein
MRVRVLAWMPRIVSDLGELLWKRRIFRDLVEVAKPHYPDGLVI